MQLPDSRPLAPLGLQQQQQQQYSASHASTSSSASMETSKFAGGGLNGSSVAVPTGAPASSASLRLSSFRAEVLESCALMDQGRKGSISARELKYGFVSCMGFKPSKVSSSKRRENGACWLVALQWRSVECGWIALAAPLTFLARLFVCSHCSLKSQTCCLLIQPPNEAVRNAQ